MKLKAAAEVADARNQNFGYGKIQFKNFNEFVRVPRGRKVSNIQIDFLKELMQWSKNCFSGACNFRISVFGQSNFVSFVT